MSKNNNDKIKKGSKQIPLIRFTDDFWIFLDKISQTSNSEIAWFLYELDSNPIIKNVMRISEVDISNKEGRFSVKISGSRVDIRISAFIKNYFGTSFSDIQIQNFIKSYNRIIGGITTEKDDESKKIEPMGFEYDPSDIKSTFISLVTETYPYGHEEEVLKYLPTFLKKDKHGNYYHIIGKSDTAFTCHLDTASRKKSGVNLREFEKDGQTFIKTDGTSILGADDKAGVTVLLYMIHNNIPGVYWFFIGEERGGIGSRNVARDLNDYSFMNGVKKVISFDRRNYYSVITSQMGVSCCSNEFAQSLCDELNKSGLKITLDPTGIFTDSASFIDLIPECTNISVGYFDEHQNSEIQNISYLIKLCKAVISCDWNKLVVKRKVGIDEDISKKYNRLVSETKRLMTSNKIKLTSEDGKLIYNIDIINGELNYFHDDMVKLEELFNRYRKQPIISFNENTIKIEIE